MIFFFFLKLFWYWWEKIIVIVKEKQNEWQALFHQKYQERLVPGAFLLSTKQSIVVCVSSNAWVEKIRIKSGWWCVGVQTHAQV